MSKTSRKSNQARQTSGDGHLQNRTCNKPFFLWTVSSIVLGVFLISVVVYCSEPSNRKSKQVEKNVLLSSFAFECGKTKTRMHQRDPIDKKSLSEWDVLREIILSHPHPDVSQTMFRLIDEQELFLNFQPTEEYAALFFLLERDVRTPTPVSILSSKKLPDTLPKDIPVLNINIRVLEDERIPKEMIQLTLVHELRHYFQYKRDLQLGKSLSTFRLSSPEQPQLTDHEIANWIKNEIEAYEEQCVVAVRQGWECDDQICWVYKTQDKAFFRESVINILSRGNINGLKKMREVARSYQLIP